MTIYFAFSDENGSYKCERGHRFIKSHPYYIRSTIIINGDSYKKINHDLTEIKRKFELPINKEIKWSYIWSIKKHQEKSEPIKSSVPYSFLEGVEYGKIKDFIEKAVLLLNCDSYCKCILTVTENLSCNKISEKNLIKMHLQEFMQRIEMEMQNDPDNLCILFIDPTSEKNDKLLRESYSEIQCSGDYITNYKHIKDSLNIEYSHHSTGIQLADYLAGSFSSCLRGYDFGKHLYYNHFKKMLRCDVDGKCFGYGIREVPSSQKLRIKIENILKHK